MLRHKAVPGRYAAPRGASVEVASGRRSLREPTDADINRVVTFHTRHSGEYKQSKRRKPAH
eukprot:6946026-Prymnesium_polylepis.2